MTPEDLKRIERWNWLFAALLVAGAAVFFGRDVVLGVAVGALLGAVNFWSIRSLAGRVLKSSGGRRTALQVLLVGKMAILFALVYLAMRFLPVSIVALGVGLSVFLLSVAVESVRHAFAVKTVKGDVPDGRA
ncbi:MAG TPA: ATP synthase subunit I [Haliangiales bacterium]|nr:ATP synthase subunit I [Haliangiales bacterium]